MCQSVLLQAGCCTSVLRHPGALSVIPQIRPGLIILEFCNCPESIVPPLLAGRGLLICWVGGRSRTLFYPRFHPSSPNFHRHCAGAAVCPRGTPHCLGAGFPGGLASSGPRRSRPPAASCPEAAPVLAAPELWPVLPLSCSTSELSSDVGCRLGTSESYHGCRLCKVSVLASFLHCALEEPPTRPHPIPSLPSSFRTLCRHCPIFCHLWSAPFPCFHALLGYPSLIKLPCLYEPHEPPSWPSAPFPHQRSPTATGGTTALRSPPTVAALQSPKPRMPI